MKDIRKILKMVSFVCVFVWSYFSNNVLADQNDTVYTTYPESFRSETDYRYMDGFVMKFLESEDVYYQIGNDGYLYCSGKEEIDWIPLCGKPECSHEDDSCNAYIGIKSGIGCYKDKIYYVGQAMDVVKGEISSYWYLGELDMDGSSHNMICKLDYPSTVNNFYLIHRGVFYYINNKWIEGTFSVYMFMLDKESTHMIELMEGQGQCNIVRAFDESVYFQCVDENTVQWMEYKPETDQVTKLSLDIQGSILYADYKFIYSGSIGSGSIFRYEKQDGKGEQIVDFNKEVSVEMQPLLLCDGNYFYCFIRKAGRVLVYNMEGIAIGEAKFPADEKMNVFIADGKIFVYQDIEDIGIWNGYFEFSEKDGEILAFTKCREQ